MNGCISLGEEVLSHALETFWYSTMIGNAACQLLCLQVVPCLRKVVVVESYSMLLLPRHKSPFAIWQFSVPNRLQDLLCGDMHKI